MSVKVSNTSRAKIKLKIDDNYRSEKNKLANHQAWKEISADIAVPAFKRKNSGVLLCL